MQYLAKTGYSKESVSSGEIHAKLGKVSSDFQRSTLPCVNVKSHRNHVLKLEPIATLWDGGKYLVFTLTWTINK